MTDLTEYGDVMINVAMDEWGRQRIDSLLEDGARAFIIGAVLKEVIDSLGLTDSLYANKILPIVDSSSLLDQTVVPWRTLSVSDSVSLIEVSAAHKGLILLDIVTLMDAVLASKLLAVLDAVGSADLVDRWVAIISGIIGVKRAVIDLLKADLTLQSLLTRDLRGQWPIYHSLIQQEVHMPCITVECLTEDAEVSAFNDAFDGLKRFEWCLAIIQVDCWSRRHAEERDRLATAVEKCLLKNPLSGTIYVQDPTVMALDETDVKPPLWRKSLRFKVMYIFEA